MSDYDLDRLNAAFSDLRQVASGYVKPAGIKAARAVARRRRTTRTALLGIVALMLLVLPLAAFAQLDGDKTAPIASSTPPATHLESLTPSASSEAPGAPSGTATGAPKNSGLAYAPVWIEALTSGYGVELPKSGTGFAVPFGVRVWGGALATNVKLTVDLSQILAKVQVVQVGSPCVFGGSAISCDFGNLAAGSHLREVTLAAREGAASGRVGDVKLSVSAREDSSYNKLSDGYVSVSYYNLASDIVTSSTVPSGRVGDTVTVVTTVRNAGPDLEPYYKLWASQQIPGTEYTGGEGCVTTATTFECRVDNLTVGSTVTFKLHIKILNCDPMQRNGSVGLGYETAHGDPLRANDDAQVKIKVNGC